MNKNAIIKKLKDLGVDFDPNALKNELENVLVAAEKEKGKPTPGQLKAEATKPEEVKPSGKITAEDLKNFPPILPGQKDIRATIAEVKELRDQGILCGHDPKSGVARIKG